MPITKSAKKSLKVSRTKRAQNATRKALLMKAMKKTDGKNLNEVISIIDKAAKRNIIHKNKAARMKSKLMKKYPITQKAAKEVKKEALKKTAVKKIAKKK